MSAKLVWYVELRGDNARAELQVFLAGLTEQPGFVSAELLTSLAQAGLMLATSRWVEAVPEIVIPAGAKSWVFEIVTD